MLLNIFAKIQKKFSTFVLPNKKIDESLFAAYEWFTMSADKKTRDCFCCSEAFPYFCGKK